MRRVCSVVATGGSLLIVRGCSVAVSSLADSGGIGHWYVGQRALRLGQRPIAQNAEKVRSGVGGAVNNWHDSEVIDKRRAIGTVIEEADGDGSES